MLVAAILAGRRIPTGLPLLSGILRLARRHDPARLGAACARALAAGAGSYRQVNAILRRGLDRTADATATAAAALQPAHRLVP